MLIKIENSTEEFRKLVNAKPKPYEGTFNRLVKEPEETREMVEAYYQAKRDCTLVYFGEPIPTKHSFYTHYREVTLQYNDLFDWFWELNDMNDLFYYLDKCQSESTLITKGEDYWILEFEHECDC